MAKVKLAVGGRSYHLACRDGEEADLERAARYLDEKATALLGALGSVSESQLLLMAGLQVCGELLASNNHKDAPAETLDSAQLADILTRMERLKSNLEKAAEKV